MNARPCDRFTGRSTDARVMLYLLENGPTGIGALRDRSVGSTDGLIRALKDLIIEGLVSLDTSRSVGGRPYELTPAGRRVAFHLKAAEDALPPHREPPA